MISIWKRRVDTIQKTFKTNDAALWERMVAENSHQTTWSQIKEIIDGNGTKKGLIENLKELGDGENPGVFTTAYNRVTRPYINIGVVGAYRQGKSTLLKQLIKPSSEQLSSRDIIPTNTGGIPCTGTSVNYINCDNNVPAAIAKNYPSFRNVLPQGTDVIPRAVVRYNTIQDMCETVNKYIEECGSLKDWDPIDTNYRHEFEEYCVRNSGRAMAIPNAQQNTLEATFRTIILEYEKYTPLLGRDDELIEDLRNSENRELFYRRSTFNYSDVTSNNYSVYAVKAVDVFMCFKVAEEEVGPIQFLDTPGVGEKRVGVDETLRNKLTNEIDTVIAIEKAHDQAPATTALTSFHSSLTENYGEKQSGFIYYIINDTTSCKLDLINQAYTRAFRDGIESTSSPIRLPIDRKLLVDCERNNVYNYTPNPDGTIANISLNTTSNCQSILYSIVENLAQNIESIDRDFTTAADSLYSEVSQQIDDLQKLAQKIIINVGNNTVAVNATVQALCTELAMIQNNSIVDTIVLEIQEYAKTEDVGTEVLYSLKKLHQVYDAVLTKDKIELIIKKVRACEDVEKKATVFAVTTFDIIGKNGPCTSLDYDQWLEFRSYCDTKCNLYERITTRVQQLVSPKPIQERLHEAQKELYAIFRKDNYLGFVCGRGETDSIWYKNLMDSVSDAVWKDRFDAFFLYDVEDIVQDFISREIIRKTIKKYMHNDNFSGSLFDTLQNANISFLKSLWRIENAIKKSLRNENDSILDALKADVNQDFIEKRAAAINFGFGVPNSMNPQMVHFISVHYNEVLKRMGIEDELQRKTALYEQWQKIN